VYIFYVVNYHILGATFILKKIEVYILIARGENADVNLDNCNICIHIM
jgi:hypothetical protein